MKLPNVLSKRSHGGAHIGFAMFGARGPLLEGADSGTSGGGTGGATGAKPNGPPPPAPTPPPGNQGGTGTGSGGSEPRMYSADEVEGIVQQRLARERKKGSGGQQQAPGGTQSEAGTSGHDDTSWMFDLSDAMDEVVQTTGVRPTPAAKKKLREDYQRERPGDGVAFVSKWFTDLGLAPASSSSAAAAGGKPGSQTTPNNPADGKKPDAKQGNTTTVPPLSNVGPPSGGPRDVDSITDPNELTRDDIDRLESQLGREKANEKIRVMAEKWASRTRLKVKPDKR